MEAGTISEWKVKEGEAFSAGDIICMVETDKVNSLCSSGRPHVLTWHPSSWQAMGIYFIGIGATMSNLLAEEQRVVTDALLEVVAVLVTDMSRAALLRAL